MKDSKIVEVINSVDGAEVLHYHQDKSANLPQLPGSILVVGLDGDQLIAEIESSKFHLLYWALAESRDITAFTIQ